MIMKQFSTELTNKNLDISGLLEDKRQIEVKA